MQTLSPNNMQMIVHYSELSDDELYDLLEKLFDKGYNREQVRDLLGFKNVSNYFVWTQNINFNTKKYAHPTFRGVSLLKVALMCKEMGSIGPVAKALGGKPVSLRKALSQKKIKEWLESKGVVLGALPVFPRHLKEESQQ